MCLKDLSRSKSMVILIRRVLVGQKQIRMDLEEVEKKKLEKMRIDKSLEEVCCKRGLKKGVITRGRECDQKEIFFFYGRNKKLV